LILAAALFFTTAAAFAQGDDAASAGVEDTGGMTGIGEGGELLMEEITIEGRLEKPVGLFLKRQEPVFSAVHFTRNFWDDILNPLDKEEFEKAVKESKFDIVKNPLLWIAVTSTILTGAACGYQYYNGESTSGLSLAIACGVSAASMGVLLLIDKSKGK
jgi:hypothetical protein